MIYLIFAGLIIWCGSTVARGFLSGLGLLSDHSLQSITPVVHTDVADGRHSSDFDEDLPTNNFLADSRFDGLEDGIPNDSLKFDTSQFSNPIADGAGIYINSADAASHGATCQLDGEDGGIGLYM